MGVDSGRWSRRPLRRWAAIALSAFSALAACGGQARRPSDEPMGTNSPSSGGAQSEPDSGLAGAADSVGGQGYVSLIHSGTRTCPNDDYCFGLSCYAPPSFEPSVCLAPCATDRDCLSAEACVGSAKLEPTCYARCDSPADCYRGFDCYDFSGVGQFVCFPAGWAGRRSELD